VNPEIGLPVWSRTATATDPPGALLFMINLVLSKTSGLVVNDPFVEIHIHFLPRTIGDNEQVVRVPLGIMQHTMEMSCLRDQVIIYEQLAILT
jgi:hypothetical protein